MKKRKDNTTVIAVCIAVLCVALAAYVAGIKTGEPRTPEVVSPTEMAQRQAKGMGAYFNLDEQKQESIFRLYKAYDEIQASYGEKIDRAENRGVPMTPYDTREFADAITVAKQELEIGIKAILTENQYEKWRKKEWRAQITYK